VGRATGSLEMRRRVIETAQALNALHLNRGKAGNVSVRAGDAFLVTPSGMAYDALAADDIVAIAADGAVEGARTPSSEWPMHRAIYAARPEIAAIVHAHSPFATALACLDRGIPAFHYMVAVAGGHDVRCASYATFGTPELARNAVAALDGRRACLLAHHGLIAGGATLEHALAVAVDVEALAEIYCRALAIGEPSLLSDAEMVAVVEQFRGYGQRGGGGADDAS